MKLLVCAMAAAFVVPHARPALKHTAVVESIVEGALDTLEDAVTHARRLVVTRDVFNGGDIEGRERVVVLGSGWGAHALMKVIDARKFDVVVVSPLNHFLFTPMLPAAAVGTVEYRSMTESVRRSNPLVEYVEGEAVDVDPHKQTVTVAVAPEERFSGGAEGTTATLNYDRLVVACGVRVNDGIVDGAAEHCYKLKSCEDAVKLRRAVGSRFETAARMHQDAAERRRLLTFVVVGGGPTGVELAGEMIDFVKDITRRFPRLNPDDVSVKLVHAGADLVQQFEEPQRVEARRVLEAQGVDVVLGARVKRVGETQLTLQTQDSVTDLPYGLCVWCAGTAPQPFMEALLSRLPHSAKAGRFVAIDEWLRVRLGDNHDGIKPGSILALGDTARLVRTEGDDFLPQTAQVASQQGAYVARLLNRQYDTTHTPPVLLSGALDDKPLDNAWLALRNATVAPVFQFLNLGMLAYLGSGNALAEVKFGNLPLGAYAGSAAYLLWKSVYLTKQVATRNRLLVTFDWLKCDLFGRDITRL